MSKFIKLKFFTRNNGSSKGIYKSLNCGHSSKDKHADITKNIQYAVNQITNNKKLLILPDQYHSNKCTIVGKSNKNYQCDGLVTNNPNIILGVTTADCLPVILIDQKKKIIGICHAGWRGLTNGIIENTLKKMIKLDSRGKDIQVFIGPCIRKMSYEVSNSFIKGLKPSYQIFSFKSKGKYYYDLPKLAKYILNQSNIHNIHDFKKNTFVDSNYFSYRESKKKGYSDYGRNISMVTLN